MARRMQALDVMREYHISFYARLRQRPTGPLFYIRTVIVAARLHDARRQLYEYEAYQDVQDVKVLRHRDVGDWVYPNQEAL